MIRLLDLYEGDHIREGALEFLYDLMKERTPEISISHTTLPTFEQHRQFVTRRPYRLWYMIEPTGTRVIATKAVGELPVYYWVGYVSATPRNEIGVVLAKAYRGQGYGPLAIRELMRLHEPLPAEPSVRAGRWLANIAPGNEHSQYIFRDKLGFKKIQETYQL